MKLNVFAVYDEKSEVYQMPFYFVFKGEAIRFFQDMCSDSRYPYAKHLSDYALYRLGEFDDRAGEFVSLKAPEFVVKAVDFKPEV
jgi:hypothetical protein